MLLLRRFLCASAGKCLLVNESRYQDLQDTHLIDEKHIKPVLPRRKALGLMAGAVCACVSAPALSASKNASSTARFLYPDRKLSLHNVHTGEMISTVYWSNGQYIADSLDDIDWILRDFRTSETRKIDPRLLNILYLLNRKLDTNKPVQVLSAYRSKKTNDMLRRTTEGVAKRSFHMQARAIDIRIPQIETRNINIAALRLGGGGVGFYPESNFVHLDTGPVRTW